MSTFVTVILSLMATFEASTAPYFPGLKASSLTGEVISLPDGLEGTRNLVLIAFEREQQADLDTWLKVLPAIASKHRDFRYYELPTIQRPAKLVQMFINSGMRGGIPDHQQRARTITLYIDKKPFKEAMHIESEKMVYAFLIDKSGKVLWRGEGLCSPQKQESLTAFLSRQD